MNNLAPNRSNLMKQKEKLEFAKMGYELLDQKRQILVTELLALVDSAVDYQNKVESALRKAEESLCEAIMHMGRLRVANLAGAVNITSTVTLGNRKIMGVNLPTVSTEFSGNAPYFSPEGISFHAELAVAAFSEALSLMGRMAELKVSIMRLSKEVKNTVRKVNSLDKFVIPETEESVRYLKMRIEEAERDSFILMKAVKERLGGGL